ncbi:MAG: hypothetical protein JW720_09190 [Sedimentisphaerales bacterium]|nr:hypothetical protein [Sedimentisphaerales bacterium]
MKKTAFALVVVCCFALPIHGELWVSVNGEAAWPGDSGISLNRGDTVLVGIWGDGITAAPLEGFLFVQGPGSIDGHTLEYIGTASEYLDIEQIAEAMDMSEEEVLSEYGLSTGKNLTDMSKWLLDDGASPPHSLDGMLIDNVTFRCEGAGDVLLTLKTDDPMTAYPDYTIVIHQTAENRTYHVDANEGDDGNTGLTPEEAFATIQKAIDSAYNGDSIIVLPGRYKERINFLGKNISLTSADPADPCVVASTTIDFDDSYYPAVVFRGTENPSCILAGFNIDGFIRGKDLFLEPPITTHTHATITRCTFLDNGGKCGTVVQFCDGLISECLFASNNYFYCIGLYPVIDGCHGLIKNCTIANSRDGLGIRVQDGTTSIENCILYNDEITLGTGAIVNISYTRWEPPVHVQGSPIEFNLGPGNIEADPCFADPNAHDYHLKSQAGRWDPESKSWLYDGVTSPCIDAGNPGSLLGDEPPGLFNVRINMGAHGGTAEASRTPPNWSLRADLTNDGIIDAQDYAYQTQNGILPGLDIPGDINRNARLDMDDIAALVGDWLKTTNWR